MTENYNFMDAMTEKFATINRIGKDEESNNPVTLRFPYPMGDVNGWVMMKEEWLENEERYNYSIWKRTDTRGKIIFAVALNTKDNSIGVWRIKYRLAEQLMAYGEDVVNRDFTITRSGEGLDTKYLAKGEDSKPMTDAQRKIVDKNKELLHEELEKLLAKSHNPSDYEEFMQS